MNDETEIPMSRMPLSVSHGLFPSCLFYVFLYSDYMYFFLSFDLTYIFMPFPLLSFLHVSLAILT